MDFGLGLFIGMFIMWAIAKKIQIEIMKELEKLKDFDTWKEWKNKQLWKDLINGFGKIYHLLEELLLSVLQK